MRQVLWRCAAILSLVCLPAYGVLDPADPDVQTFKSTEDAGFSSLPGESLVNRGLSTSIRCKSSQEMVIMKFDVSSLAGMTISEAELHVTASSSSRLYAADVCTIVVPWTEGTRSGGFTNAVEGDCCWEWRRYPGSGGPVAEDYWTVPGSNFAHATFGNYGSLSCYAHPDGVGFTRYTNGSNTVYRIKLDPDVIHALVLDQYGLTLSDTRGYLLQNNTVYTRDQNATVAPTLLIKAAVTDTTPPGPLSGLSAEAGAWNGEVLLSFAAPTDSGPKAKAFGYDVRYSLSPIDAGNFAAATQVPRWRIPRPQAAGTVQKMVVTDLVPGSTCYFALRAYDQAGNATAVVTTSLTLPATQSVVPFADASFASPAPAAGIPGVPGVLRYWACSEYSKVNPVTGNRYADGYSGSSGNAYKLGNPVWDAATNKVVLKGARNEVVGFQLILERLVASLTDVRVSVSNLASPYDSIPADPNIELLRSWYVPSGGVYYPEPCIPLAAPFGTTFSIPNSTNGISSQTNQSVWCDIHVPADKAPGIYTGTITVTAAQLASPLTIDLELEVRRFVLPDEVSFIVDLNGYNTPWNWGIGGQDVAATKLSYFQVAHKHRQNVNTVPYGHTLANAAGNYLGRPNADRTPVLSGSGASTNVTDWTAFDAEWGPYLDGSAFSAAAGYTGPGADTPVPAWYTPIYESWPLSMYHWFDRFNVNGIGYWHTICPGPSLVSAFLMNSPDPAAAFPADYETGVKNVVRAFAEHAQAKGWHKTFLQIYLNNKYSWGNATNPHSQFWNLDEPSEGECMRALGYFNKIYRQGADAAAAPDVKWHFRIDISDRTGYHRGTMDGSVNLWDSSGINDYHTLIPQRQLNWPDEQWWYYGGGGSPTGSELANPQRFLQAWCWYVDGALPYWQCYSRTVGSTSTSAWNGAENLCVLYAGDNVPGYGLQSRAFASARMKQMRRGQQDIEYLAYLANKGIADWDRPAVIRALQQRYADAGGDSYGGMNELRMFQMREDVAATIPDYSADLDGDSHVSMFDILVIAAVWNTSVGDPGYSPLADIDKDGAVNIFDIFAVAEQWGL